MQYFPDTFPIRYAITVMDHTASRKDASYFNEARSKVLWHQFIDLLQTEPLGPEHLSLNYTTLGFAYRDVQLCSIPRLMASKDWADDGVERMQELLPEGRFSSGWGSAFSLGLLSYKGMLDRPLFLQVYNHIENRDFVGKDLGLYSWGHIGMNEKDAERIFNQYTNITEKADYWEYERLRSTQQLDVINIRVPYSPLWGLLDKSRNKGIIPAMAETTEIEVEELDKFDMKGAPSHIQVTVVKSISALFWEEMSALYRVANFCNNCGRVLRYDRSTKYCDKEDNPACHKDRDRKRQRKSSQKN